MTTESKNNKIFPLSESERTPETNGEHTNFPIYKSFLDAAFQEPRIHNIAITGAFGIGKSSVIHSYDYARQKEDANGKAWLSKWKRTTQKDGKQTFLYISLGQFAAESKTGTVAPAAPVEDQLPAQPQEGNTTVSQADKGTAEDGKNSDKKQNDQVNQIERRLLLQIYARFQRKDLPASSFKLIPEELSLLIRIAGAVYIGFLVLMTLLLAFHERFGKLLVRVFPCCAEYTSVLHFALLFGYFVLLAVAAGFLSYWVLSQLRMKGFAVKSDAMEMELEKKTDLSYIDQYSTEIIYCLAHIGKKIDYTVVFEDLDRFSPDTCVEIFTRLHEINHLVNVRLRDQSKTHLRFIRFIYVINDELLGSLRKTKFFDYIMPVIPVLNGGSAEIILRENLEKLRVSSSGEYENDALSAAWDKLLSNDQDGLLHKVAPYLQDFRTQYSILNEFSLLFSIYVQREDKQVSETDAEPVSGANTKQVSETCAKQISETDAEPVSEANTKQVNETGAKQISETDAEQILAFAIYKTFWPEDYSKIRDGKSQIFPIRQLSPGSEEWNGFDNRELLEILLGPNEESSYLSMRCLYYIGFDENKVAAERERILKGDCTKETKLAIINGICSWETASIEKVTAYCSEFFFKELVYAEKGVPFVNEEHREQFDILTAVIQCVVRCGWTDNAWFFEGKDIMGCIRILAILDSRGEQDTVQKFIKLSYHGPTDSDSEQDSVFADCKGWTNINELNEWPYETWKIFRWGTRSWKNDDGKQKHTVHIGNSDVYLEAELKKGMAII